MIFVNFSKIKCDSMTFIVFYTVITSGTLSDDKVSSGLQYYTIESILPDYSFIPLL